MRPILEAQRMPTLQQIPDRGVGGHDPTSAGAGVNEIHHEDLGVQRVLDRRVCAPGINAIGNQGCHRRLGLADRDAAAGDLKHLYILADGIGGALSDVGVSRRAHGLPKRRPGRCSWIRVRPICVANDAVAGVRATIGGRQLWWRADLERGWLAACPRCPQP
jgi:hypothetical protein